MSKKFIAFALATITLGISAVTVHGDDFDYSTKETPIAQQNSYYNYIEENFQLPSGFKVEQKEKGVYSIKTKNGIVVGQVKFVENHRVIRVKFYKTDFEETIDLDRINSYPSEIGTLYSKVMNEFFVNFKKEKLESQQKSKTEVEVKQSDEIENANEVKSTSETPTLHILRHGTYSIVSNDLMDYITIEAYSFDELNTSIQEYYLKNKVDPKQVETFEIFEGDKENPYRAVIITTQNTTSNAVG